MSDLNDIVLGLLVRERVLDALVEKGNARSGHRGHLGRKGHKGGSLPRAAGLAAAAAAAKPPEAIPEDQLPLEELSYDARERRLLRALENAELEDVKPLGGGIRETSTATLVGFGKVKLKVAAWGAEVAEAHNELAVGIINHEMGNLVPELPVAAMYTPSKSTRVGQYDRGTPFLISEFRKGKILSGYDRVAALPASGVDNAALLDRIIGNLDGHGNNYIVVDDKKMVQIDLGISMPTGTLRFQRSEALEQRRDHGRLQLTSQERRLLTDFAARKTTLTPKLTQHVSALAAGSMWDRVDGMLDSGKIPSP